MDREYPMSTSEVLQEMREWCKLMETGYISNNGASLNPVDAYNLMCLLDEARQIIERLRRFES